MLIGIAHDILFVGVVISFIAASEELVPNSTKTTSAHSDSLI